jgi:hypothetical protein
MSNHKNFRHNLVPFEELKSETINGERYYTLPDGVTKLKSVTTILAEKSDKTKLIEWRERVGEKEANKISEQSKRRGNAIHDLAENYIRNNVKYKAGHMPINIDMFKPIKKILDKHVDDIYGIELPLYSTALGCAGKTDLVAHYNDIPSIIDFKNSKKTKKESWIEDYFLQSTIYSMMFERKYKIKIPQIVIIITVEDEPNPQIFVKRRSEFVNKSIEILTN